MGPQGQTCKILQLSDCTMMYILSYLDATSLFNLSRTCSYFKNIVEDPQLWKYIEARRKPNTSKKVQYVCDRVHDKTAYLFLRAESKYEGQVLPNFLHAMRGLENLTILALENQRLDGRMLTLSEFPKSLEELSFKKTHVKNGKLFFQGSFHVMRNLKVLILDECDWVDSNFFLSIAKYEKLEILSIVKCMRLHLNVIPYLSVARHGCKNLKLIDCRFNTIGNEILRTFDSQKSLLALYFQSMSSYELDKGTPFMRCPPLTCEYHDLIAQSIIKNHSLDQFRYILGDLVEDIPHSVLYTDPYPECTCGYKDRINNEPVSLSNESTKYRSEPSQPPARSMPVDDYIDFHLSPQRFICRRHVKELNKLPKDFKNFFYQNQKKFYPDSSDNDSDSDEERDCCMFGVGKSQQMIVLKVREVDEQGNLPPPEVVDISPSRRNVISIDIGINRSRAVQRRESDIDYQDQQPSTSRHDSNDSPSEAVQNTAKRKAEEDGREADQKKTKTAGASYSNTDTNQAPSTSEAQTSSINSKNNQGSENETKCESGSSNSGPEKCISPKPGPSHGNEKVDTAGPSRARAASTQPGCSRTEAFVLPRVEAPRRQDLIRLCMHDQLLENDDNQIRKIKLRRLSLRGYTEITDEALYSLKNLSLDLLDVTYTGITKEGVEKFLTFNPNCRVIHRDYCVCKPRIPV